MKVKICGITNLDDALYAAKLGANALGFIFVQSSPRYISPEAAREIISALPPTVMPIGIVMDKPGENIFKIISQTGIRCIQLHGNETPQQCVGFKVPVIKAFRVGNNFDVQQLSQYPVSAYLLDTHIDNMPGGTGKQFDWNIAQRAKSLGRIILAGGLSPENIEQAVRLVQPYAIDTNSGVESSPGKKDHEKMKLLFEKISKLNLSETEHSTSKESEKGFL